MGNSVVSGREDRWWCSEVGGGGEAGAPLSHCSAWDLLQGREHTTSTDKKRQDSQVQRFGKPL